MKETKKMESLFFSLWTWHSVKVSINCSLAELVLQKFLIYVSFLLLKPFVSSLRSYNDQRPVNPGNVFISDQREKKLLEELVRPMPLGAHRAWTKCASKHVLNKVMFFCCSLTKTYLFLNFFISRFTSLLSFLETIDCCWIWWHATSALRLFVQDLGTATVQPLLVEQPSVLAVFVACSFNSACDATFATRKLFAMLLWDFRQYVGSFIFNDTEWNCLNCIQVRSLERFLGAATQRVIFQIQRFI